MFNVVFYLILWLLAEKVGAIPVTGDFFGIRGPWCETFFLSAFLSSVEGSGCRGLFCNFYQISISLFVISMISLFITALAGFMIKPGWKGILLLVVSVAQGYVLMQHLVFLD